MTPEVCPNCGAEVPCNAKACPECGSDEKTGWSETAYASGLGLPDEEFDHDEFVKEEFGSGRAKTSSGAIELNHEGTHAHIAHIHWSTRGVVR